MKRLLVCLLLVGVVGCGEKEPKDIKAKAATESQAGAWVSVPNNPNNLKIETAIRMFLSKPTGELSKDDLEQFKWLYVNHDQLTDVTGLEKLTQLTDLYLDNNQLTDVTGLEKLTQLTMLDLTNNQLAELPKGLEKLTQLTMLDLTNNQLTDVTGLEKLTQLTDLHLGSNPDLTEAQIDQLQKALPNCVIYN